MSNNYNKVTLIGRVTKDIELEEIDEDIKVSIVLAVDRPYISRSGELETDFISVIMFGRLARMSKDFIKKGVNILVEGRIQVITHDVAARRNWITEVIAENFQVLNK